MLPFADRLAERAERIAPTCVGIDPHLDRLPAVLRADIDPVGAARAFCLAAVDAVADHAAAIKPQAAFFEAMGSRGVAVLEEVCAAGRDRGLLVVLDAKRGDIGSTAEAYAVATLDPNGPMAADAVTLSPYLGAESLAPFVKRCDAGHGLFVLVRTSNPGSGAWQAEGTSPIASRVAAWIAEINATRLGSSGLGPVGAVVGATVSEDAWRERMPDAWFLVPGYGAQGATADDVRRHMRPNGSGALVVSARGVLYPKSGDDGHDWKQALTARAKTFATAIRDLSER